MKTFVPGIKKYFYKTHCSGVYCVLAISASQMLLNYKSGLLWNNLEKPIINQLNSVPRNYVRAEILAIF